MSSETFLTKKILFLELMNGSGLTALFLLTCLFFWEKQKMWQQSANFSHSLRWESLNAPWEFQTEPLRYFFMSNHKNNLHFSSFFLAVLLAASLSVSLCVFLSICVRFSFCRSLTFFVSFFSDWLSVNYCVCVCILWCWRMWPGLCANVYMYVISQMVSQSSKLYRL